MRPTSVFQTAAAVLLSVSLGAEARPEIANVDPENYVATEVPANVAKGGIRKLYEQGTLSFNTENEGGESEQLSKRNLRSRSLGYTYGYGYGAAAVTPTFDDDRLVAEETITLQYYQDNRFSPPDPIFASPLNPSPTATGNRWLYANVPLQPIFGINDLPIQGLAQGYCESTLEEQDGYCHFTYEFFDLQDGAIVVYASITAEGATNAQGPSTLNVLGGTGEFQGAVGEVTLWPVGIDESTIPARIFKDGSLFLGNRNGYDAKFDISVRYLLNAPQVIPVPVTVPIPANPVPAPGAAAATATAAGFVTRVTCPGQEESEYCDCSADCTTTSPRCECPEAQTCCGK